MLKNPKVLNPEARLQASVARDIKLRHLEEHSRSQADALAAAKWEVAVSEKDEHAMKKRIEEQIFSDTKLSKITNTNARKAMLQQLFLEDERKYENDLTRMGLSYRKENT
jgi:hypothetical protein